MIGKFHLPISAGGSLPDPSTYCPANGYIPNPINQADGWVLIAEFQNNSPSTTTFDPTIIASSGQYAWDLGDGTILIGDQSVSHTYLTTATRIVKLYGKGTRAIISIDFNSDDIIGELYFSDSAFNTINSFRVYSNLSITSVILPSTTGNISSLLIYSTGIIGTLDLSSVTTLASNTVIDLHSNSLMTAVNFASLITSGNIATLNIYSTGISGVLDLSKLTTFNSSAQIYLHSNTYMTDVIFPSTITGTVTSLSMYSTGIAGVLDLSKFTAFTTTASLNIGANPSMTGIVFATAITGSIATLIIDSTGITGSLDLSKFTSYSTAATVYLNGNPSMTGVTFPASTITGFIRTLRLYSNTSLGYVDLTNLRTGVNSLNWDMKNNGWTAAIVNRVLTDIDSISAAGFTGRVINIGGTNADPDTTSGGYNGTAARNSLITKGFTVTIT